MPSATSPSARLAVLGIRIPVRLGCLPGEQDEPQAVEFDVTVRFAQAPAATRTDDLGGTVDYAMVVQCISETVEDRRFHLVEYLASEVFGALRSELSPEHGLELQVRKVAPPIPEITGGAVFTLTG